MSAESRFGLPLSAVEKLREVFRGWPQIRRAMLYGSRAKGNYRPGSDIDLTVEGEDLSLSQLLAIESQIDDLLLPWMVDLSLRKDIDNPELLDHIERVGVLFYCRERGDSGADPD
ncbi:Predicted nucleotidyltransferase [Geopseudomonas sagittaria]|uniref:Predicted nucleotidyltransferase n=1 Tax=Geopseudomonas sagittaria TaxID=1135990 RepID=A0A1I5QG67_9GAMM|nr:nucleotidyltransferase domain-containing protein [Pseudomonas sagittaria]MCM2318408.1 nucleotidyltransferase domain-containing protein [Pseudomonas sp.]SFP45233.1 Predicted nucleotidyltransferase [Pseudomonas sagittaria]